MDLNNLAVAIVTQLTRIADALSSQITVSASAETSAPAKAAPAKAAPAKAAPAKAAPAKSAKPKNDRDAVKKALITVKDTISKEAAQAIYQEFGYEAMSAIEDKDFDAIFEKCAEALAANDDGGDEAEDDGL